MGLLWVAALPTGLHARTPMPSEAAAAAVSMPGEAGSAAVASNLPADVEPPAGESPEDMDPMPIESEPEPASLTARQSIRRAPAARGTPPSWVPTQARHEPRHQIASARAPPADA